MAAFASTLFTMVHGAWERQEADAKLGPIAEDSAFYGSVNPPWNGLELFGNLKWLVRNGALLRRDLYTERSMRQVLGIEPFITRNAYGGLGFDFRRLTSSERMAKASRGSDVCTYQAALVPRTDHAELIFECTYVRGDMPTADQVELTFGSGWKGTVHGIEAMRYDERSDGVERGLFIQLWPGGKGAIVLPRGVAAPLKSGRRRTPEDVAWCDRLPPVVSEIRATQSSMAGMGF